MDLRLSRRRPCPAGSGLRRLAQYPSDPVSAPAQHGFPGRAHAPWPDLKPMLDHAPILGREARPDPERLGSRRRAGWAGVWLNGRPAAARIAGGVVAQCQALVAVPGVRDVHALRLTGPTPHGRAPAVIQPSPAAPIPGRPTAE
jgi:hypothetical protein